MAINNEVLIKLLRKIYIWQKKSNMSQNTLAINLNMTVRDPRFRALLTILRNHNLMIEHETVDKKLIEIRFGPLEKYIREHSEDFAEWGKFIETSRPFSYSY